MNLSDNHLKPIFLGLVASCVLWSIIHPTATTAQGTLTPPYVRLQSTTPGQPQTGHVNVAGTAIVGGQLGLGTSSPGSRLHVAGKMILDSGGDAALYTGTGPAELNRYLQLLNSPQSTSASGLHAGGVLVADDYSWGNPGKNGLLVKGKVGVGTNTPIDPLTVAGTISSTNGGFRFPNGSLQKRSAISTDHFNVKDFGARGDGQTDDTAAVQAAIDAIYAKGRGTLYFPAGDYFLTDVLSINSTISIRGEGRQVSRLIWDWYAGGMYFDGGAGGSNSRKTLWCSGLSFLTLSEGGSTGLEIRYSVPEGHVSKFVVIEDCEFAPGADGAYWQTGLSMWNARETAISRCDFRGKYVPGTGFVAGTTGLRIGGDQSPTGHAINDCTGHFLDVAFAVSGDVEGVLFANMGIVANNIGIEWNTETIKPQLVIANSHISAMRSGVSLTNCSDVFIRDVLFYQRDEATTRGNGVYVTGNSYNVNVTGCAFYGWDVEQTYDGVVASPGVRRVKAVSNHFYQVDGVAIWLMQGSRDAVVLDNDYEQVSTRVRDEGVNTRLRTLP